MQVTKENIKGPKIAAAPGKEKAADVRQHTHKAQKEIQRKLNEGEEKRVCIAPGNRLLGVSIAISLASWRHC
jgi:hypothetical protein